MLEPPPPAPVLAHQKKPPRLSLPGPGASSLHSASVFQTVSTPAGYCGFWLWPGLKDSSEVPPTLVTNGWDGGSLTARPVVPSDRMQSNAPVSPEAPNTDWPCMAICWKSVFSARTKPAPPASCSHRPQLELTESTLSSLAMAAHWSSEVWPVKSFGAL